MADATNPVWTAEREVGVSVYERVEKLVAANPSPGTSDWAELDYLSHLTASVEEVGGYDGPLTPLASSPPAREEAPAEGAGEREYTDAEILADTVPADLLGDATLCIADEAEIFDLIKDHVGRHGVDEDHLFRRLASEISTLRNRTSEPEARGAVDPSDRAYVLGALKAGVATLRSLGVTEGARIGMMNAAIDRLSRLDHPAPATADKLRVAVEAMRGVIEWDKKTGYRIPYRVRDPLYASIDLAALNEGGE